MTNARKLRKINVKSLKQKMIQNSMPVNEEEYGNL